MRALRGMPWLVILPASAYAQATMAGVVKDSSGAVLPGVTVEASSSSLIEKVRTAVTDGAGEIPVHSRGAPPQMFRDGMGVVVEGRYHPDGVFQSTNLIVKHSNEYRPPKPGESPQETYRTLMKGAGT